MFMNGVVVLSAITWTSCYAEPSAGLKTFRSAEGRFSVGFPAEATEKPTTGKSSAGSVTLTITRVTHDSCTYIISYMDNPDTPDDGPLMIAFLDTVAGRFARTSKQGKVISQRTISVDGFPGRDVVCRGVLPNGAGMGVSRMRAVLAKRRLYVVGVIGPEANMNGPLPDAVIGSFRVGATRLP
jgi:hypothetical protein